MGCLFFGLYLSPPGSLRGFIVLLILDDKYPLQPNTEVSVDHLGFQVQTTKDRIRVSENDQFDIH